MGKRLRCTIGLLPMLILVSLCLLFMGLSRITDELSELFENLIVRLDDWAQIK